MINWVALVKDQSQPLSAPFNYTIVDSAFALPLCGPASEPSASVTPNATDAF
jgi:hypothetical protein